MDEKGRYNTKNTLENSSPSETSFQLFVGEEVNSSKFL